MKTVIKPELIAKSLFLPWWDQIQGYYTMTPKDQTRDTLSEEPYSFIRVFY
jgi:hypothetical protein